ncbi:hypothetical protein POL68_09245 [Stigmatella sp. ncwal1]|uniref:Uncharacterized protein n=1 Tax=Stigmatella ashevillensis TaxID=2995309 RepID=A0ABT5D4S0_9BACT|nr:hypothetical protein [Stigmatella ashevillena]MDC0708652.1 hypothetical protein [Stigmatella ashevillena]
MQLEPTLVVDGGEEFGIAMMAGDALLVSPPPPGWRPLGPDDELLRMLLPDEEV